MGGAHVRVGEELFEATAERPFVFGRSDDDGVVGLNPQDMGVSATAGSIELGWGVWWLVNLSSKRRLLVDAGAGANPIVLDCGHRHALVTDTVRVLVPGALLTYPLDVRLPDDYAREFHAGSGQGSGTVVPGADVGLSEADRCALAAIFSGFLEPWPHRRELPNSYEAAARLAGPTWTETALRKRIERIRERFREAGYYFEGDRAREDLAAHLIGNGLLTGTDLMLLEGRREPGSAT